MNLTYVKKITNQRTKYLQLKKSHFKIHSYSQITQSNILSKGKYLFDTNLSSLGDNILMKTTIYSQKHHYQHVNPNSLTPNPYSHSGSTMSKKSSTMKKFQYCINANTMQTVKAPKQSHYHFLNQISNSNNTSTNIMKPKKPTQKPVHNVQKNIINFFVKQYQKIIFNLTNYYKYYEWILIKQIQKHDSYFNDLIKIIENQKRKSQNYLQEQIKSLSEKIQLQKAALQNKISQLENNNLKPYEKEKMQLQSQRYLQLPLFEVSLKKIDKFKSQMKKFMFEVRSAEDIQRQEMERQSLAGTLSLEESVKTEKKQKQSFDVSCLQIEEMTPIYPKVDKEETPVSTKSTIAIDDKDLYCDEDIENILKENKAVKKKRYDFRQDAIPEESQSHQDSLNISNINSIY